MPTFFAMPKLGMNMTEGTIVTWFVQEGEQVQAGQAIVAIETDKATQDVEAPASGIMARILKAESETVPCNGVMAVITEPGEDVPDTVPAVIAEGVAPKAEVEAGQARATAPQVPSAVGVEGVRRVIISPAARALAQELGVDIARIVPRGSRIHREDVEAAHQAMKSKAAPPGATSSRKPLTTMRRKIAERMSQSARSVARAGLTLEAEATALIQWRDRLGAGGVKHSHNVLLAKLVAIALREFPYMNARLENDAIVEMAGVNIGIAVDSDRGLLVPVLREVDGKDVIGLQREYALLTERALQGSSTLEDLEGGTFTITNLGSLEIEMFLPVVNFPECAILGVGAIVKKPVAIGDAIAVRPRIALTLAFDHRLVDGAPAARFLQRVKHLVENPPQE